MMITAVVVVCQFSLAVDGTAELACPNDEGFVEEPALAKVLNQRGRRQIDVFALTTHADRQVLVVVPTPVVKLNKTNAPLD